MRINHNLSAMDALRNLNMASTAQASSSQKLSSGKRITSAADDAAGLAISQGIESQIQGLDQASRNSQDAISLLQTGEGALNETQSILKRMRDLSVEAASDTYTANDRTQIQSEVDQLKSEINRIGNTTTFNGKNLLDGSASAISSTNNASTQVFVRGAIGNSGSYKLSITAQAGNAQIQKSNIFKISSGDAMNNLTVAADSGITSATGSDLRYGAYTIATTADHAASGADDSSAALGNFYQQSKPTSAAGNLFGGGALTVDAGSKANSTNMSVMAQVLSISDKTVTYSISYHSMGADGKTSKGSLTATIADVTAASHITVNGVQLNFGGGTAAGLTVGDKQTISITGNKNTAGNYDEIKTSIAGMTNAPSDVVVTAGVLNNTSTDMNFYNVDAATGQVYDGKISLNIGGLKGTTNGTENTGAGSISLLNNLTPAVAGSVATAATGAIDFSGVGNSPLAAVKASGTIDIGSLNDGGAVASTGSLELTGNYTANVANVFATGTLNLTSNLSAGTAATGSFNISAANLAGGETVTIGGITLTEGDEFTAGANAAATAQALVDAINLAANGLSTTLTAAVDGVDNTKINLTANDVGTAGNLAVETSSGFTSTFQMTGGTDADTVTVGAQTFTAGDDFAVGGTATATAGNLATAIAGAGLGVSAALHAVGSTQIDIAANTVATDGTAGNNIDLATNNATSITVSGAKLTGGVDQVTGDTVTINGHQLLAGIDFQVGADAEETTSKLLDYINDHTQTLGVSAELDAADTDNQTITITANTGGADGDNIDLAQTGGNTTVVAMDGGVDPVGADTITIGTTTLTAGVDFQVNHSDPTDTAAKLAAAIQNDATLGVLVDAAVDGTDASKVIITAKDGGTDGNTIALAQTGGNVTIPNATLLNGVNADTVTVNGHVLKAVAAATVTPAADEFRVGADAAGTAASLLAYIHTNSAILGVDASAGSSSTIINITANDKGEDGNTIAMTGTKGTISATLSGGLDAVSAVAGDTVTINGTTLTAGTDFTVGATIEETASNLATYIQTNRVALGVTSAAVDGTTNTKINITDSISAQNTSDVFTLASTGGKATLSGTPMMNDAVTFTAAEGAGQVASVSTKLSNIDKFTDPSGANIMENPQTLQLIEGDGKKTTIQLYGSDTIGDVVNKLNDAIANGLGQKDILSNTADADKFAQFVTTAAGSGPLSTAGTIAINSAKAGGDGKINIVGNEKLINALGLSDIQSATETKFSVSVTDSTNPSRIIASNVSIQGNQLIGVVDKNVDVKFASNSGIQAGWGGSGKFDLSAKSGGDETTINLVTNTQVFQIGANESQSLSAAIGDMRSAALGVDNILVTNKDSASKATTILDEAIKKVSAQQSEFGALQNRLQHTINNLGVASQNLTASQSQIQDVDMAQEMTLYSKNSILTQTANAMLAKANQSPQMVLQLLQG